MKKTVVLVTTLSILGLFSVSYLKYEKSFANDFTFKAQAAALVQPVRQPTPPIDLAVEDREYRVPLIKVDEAPAGSGIVDKEVPKTIETTRTKPTTPVQPKASVQPKTPTKAPTVVAPEKTVEKGQAAESAPAPAKAPAPDSTPHEYVYKEEMEKEIFRLTNEIRKAEGLSTLKWDKTLHSSARSHTRYMFENNVFRHTTKYRVAENIILLASPKKVETYTAQYLVDKWMASEGHRANILNPAITIMGVGVVRGDQYFGKYERDLPAIYGTQHFK